MLKFLQRFALICSVFLSIEITSRAEVLGGCDVIFSLNGQDTLCSNGLPFPIPDAFPFGGVYSGTGVVGTLFDPAVAGIGQHTITYTYTDGVCTASGSVIITVIEGSELGLIGNMVLCTPGSTTLFSESGAQYTWYDGVKSNQHIFNVTETFQSSVSGVNAEGCQITTNFTIEVGGIPAFTVSGDMELCLGESTVIYVDTEAPFQWFDGTTADSIAFTPDFGLDYTLTIFGDICDSVYILPLMALPYPELAVDYNETVCLGDTVVVVASGAASYKSFLGYFDGTFSFVPTAFSTFSVEGYNEVGCASVINLQVNVLPKPTITLNEPIEVCSGVQQLMIVEGTETFAWTDLNTGIELANSFFNELILAPADTNDYMVVGTNAVGCSDTIFFTINIYPLPILVVTESEIICEGKTTSLVATGASTYIWEDFLESDTWEFLAAQDDTLKLTGRSSDGCNAEIEFSYHVNPTPVVVISGTSTICEGDSTRLEISGANSYVWDGGAVEDTVYVSPLSDSLFSAVGTNEFGCTDFNNFMVHVNPLPDVLISGNDTICFGDATHISVASNQPIEWSFGGNQTEFEFEPIADSTISLTSLAATGCSISLDFMVTVNPLPSIFISGDNELCAGETSTLTMSGPGAAIWNNGQSGNEISVTPITTTNYHVTSTDENNCNSTSSFQIIVHQLPYAYFSFSADTVCDIGPTLTWQANPAGGVLSGDGVSNGHFDLASASVGYNEVTYTVSNEYCTDSTTAQIYVEACTGIAELLSTEMVVFPNPAHEAVQIQCDCLNAKSIRIFSSTGQLVIDQNFVSGFIKKDMNIETLTPGIYELIVFKAGNEYAMEKILVK